jgi:hypothetical protein
MGPPEGPVGPVGPVGPCITDAFNALDILEFKNIWLYEVVSKSFLTLSLACNTWSIVAPGPLIPERVPKIYCNFSPSALSI